MPRPIYARHIDFGPAYRIGVMTVVSATSFNLQASIAVAQRKVQQGQSQVQQDSERLEQSRTELSRSRERLSQTQEDSRQARQATPAAQPAAAPLRIERTIKTLPAAPAPAAQPQAQLNSRGQSIGGLINVMA